MAQNIRHDTGADALNLMQRRGTSWFKSDDLNGFFLLKLERVFPI